MGRTVLMRAYDPAGMQYVYWTSDGFDSGGSDYVGPPSFGSLIGVAAIKDVPVSGATGGSTWLDYEVPSQGRDESTSQHGLFSNNSKPTIDMPIVVGIFVTSQDRDEETRFHEGFSDNSKPTVSPTAIGYNYSTTPDVLNVFDTVT